MNAKELQELIKKIQNNDPTVKIVYLRKVSISDEEADELWDALEHNTIVTELYLSNDSINISLNGLKNITKLNNNKTIELFEYFGASVGVGDKGIEYISSWLQKNNSVKKLNLIETEITATGAKYIGEMLKINTGITSIDLSHNNIGDDGLEYISLALPKNRTLETISLHSNGIGDRGIKTLMGELELNNKVTSIDLAENDIRDESVTSIKHMIMNNKNIRHLSLKDNHISYMYESEIDSMLNDPTLMEQRTKNTSKNISSLNFMHKLSTQVKPDMHFDGKKGHKPNPPRSGV